MSIDLSQFHQVFFEESFEGFEAMGTSFMEIDSMGIDSETINTIFRTAHSIKGGSATFGFSNVEEFTHILETLLDEVRSDVRGLTRDDVDFYLQSVDCLSDLLTVLQDAEEADLTLTKQLTDSFQAILDGEQVTPDVSTNPVSVDMTESAEAAAAIETAEEAPTPRVWTIRFIPKRDILRTGNEPLCMFRELSDLGDIQVESICT